MPKLHGSPWPIRLVALVVAAGLSLYLVQIYVFGKKFMGAVAALSRPSIQATVAGPPAKGETGVVSVKIISESKAPR